MQVIEIDEDSIRPVYPEWYNQVWAIETLGYKWMSFDGIPTRGTEGYPQRQRVRQLMSPEQLASPRWQEFLQQNNGREADGDEPLSYSYCSSGCDVAIVPDLCGDDLAGKLAECVGIRHGSVSKSVGKELLRVVRKHLREAVIG